MSNDPASAVLNIYQPQLKENSQQTKPYINGKTFKFPFTTDRFLTVIKQWSLTGQKCEKCLTNEVIWTGVGGESQKNKDVLFNIENKKTLCKLFPKAKNFWAY